MENIAKRITASPPMTPPTIAPVSDFLEDEGAPVKSACPIQKSAISARQLRHQADSCQYLGFG
jgi:hypothetical protein